MKHAHGADKRLTVKDFLPLIVIFGLIIAFTLIGQLRSGWNMTHAMNDFMGAFFIVFGGFKLLNWQGFVKAYQMYDVIAKKSVIYAYAYPLIEVGLGIFYLKNLFPFWTNLVTLVVMLVSSIGVAQELAKKKTIVCACLGTVFKVPMTYVTLFEDLLMAGMALIMLLGMSR